MQTERMVHQKHAKRSWYANRSLLVHSLAQSVLAVVVSVPYCVFHHQWAAAICVGPMIFISHLVIDTSKVWLEYTERHKRKGLFQWIDELVTPDTTDADEAILPRDQLRLTPSFRLEKLFLFWVDQSLHIAVIFGICQLFGANVFMTTWTGLTKLTEGQTVMLTPAQRVLAILIVGLCATVVSSVIVQIITEPEPGRKAYIIDQKVTVTVKSGTGQDVPEEKSTETSYAVEPEEQIQRGRIIGYFERLIIVLVVLMGAYTAIAFIVAAKSLARFKKLDHQEWAEYFLVGTFCSLLCGTLSGLALKLLLNAHP